MTTRLMSEVIVYENGKVKIKDLGESNYSVQGFGIYGNKNGDGNGQYCLKGDEEKYVKILAQQFLDGIDSEIKKLQEKRKRLEKNLSKLIKE